MHASHPKESKRPVGADRPFPWQCRHCGKGQVVMNTLSYDAEVRHDGRLYTFTVPRLDIPVCQACAEKVFTEKVDEQINGALRAHLRLLTPEEMRTALARLDLTQKEVAERLGIAEATLSRWLNETQIQSRAMDNLLRVYFAFPKVREALRGPEQDPSLGVTPAPEATPARSQSAASVSVYAFRTSTVRARARHAPARSWDPFDAKAA